MKNLTKKIVVTIVAVLVAFYSSVQTEAAKAVMSFEEVVNSVSLNKNRVALLHEGNSTKLQVVSTMPVKIKSVKWLSSNDEVAVVDAKGKVTATGQGTTYVTATVKVKGCDTVLCFSCKVAVTLDLDDTIEATKLSRNKLALMQAGCEEQLELVTNFPVYKVTWTSSNENVVTVDKNGIITAVSQGETNVTAVVKVPGLDTVLCYTCYVAVTL